MIKKQVKVVGAIIENNKNQVLCALRSSTMSEPNKWEFPGGKVEDHETLFSAIEREIYEELKCHVKALEIFDNNLYETSNSIINLTCLKCNIIDGNPTSNEHAELRWMVREDLLSLDWAPADIPIVRKLI